MLAKYLAIVAVALIGQTAAVSVSRNDKVQLLLPGQDCTIGDKTNHETDQLYIGGDSSSCCLHPQWKISKCLFNCETLDKPAPEFKMCSGYWGPGFAYPLNQCATSLTPIAHEGEAGLKCCGFDYVADYAECRKECDPSGKPSFEL
ncbi:hypothetical protein HGRIS_014412 [Hohenbuehelia grisea]|uniref:Secreted protein n=1 Tax=Hohenbuehelia grisea TaxID=104357 RepID=A0ABR3JTI3_9AGAR